MNRDEVVQKLKEFLLREFPSPAGDLDEQTDLLEDWFVDSFGVVATVMFLEQEFGVPVARADVNGTNFKNLDALADYVLRAASR